jgi:hypothetical protein
MPKFGFIGPAYTLDSSNAAAQSCVNLIPERVESAPAPEKSEMVLIGRPGLTTFATLPTSPVRGIWIGENRMFAVAGAKFYEIFSNATYTDRGDVQSDGRPVQIFPNGNEVMIISNGKVWIDTGTAIVQPTFPASTGVLTAGGLFALWVSGDKFYAAMAGQTLVLGGVPVATITYVYTDELIGLSAVVTGTGAFSISGGAIPASAGAFLDGSFIVSVPNSKQFHISALNNGQSWDPLDFGIKESYPDNIATIFADHEELYLIGTQTSEVWRADPNPAVGAFPFVRDPGAMINLGTSWPNSVVRLVTGIGMLGGDPRGGPIAYHVQGYQPVRVSTHAVEQIWHAYSTTADVTSYSYVENGHHFWALNFPTANATWAYDATEKLWHQRGWWNGTTLDRQRPASHGYVFGKHMVGDWSNGKIYVQSLATLTDDGTVIQRQRAAANISNENEWSFFSQFVLDIGVDGTGNPSFILDWSKDGGHTWSTAHTKASGYLSSFLARVLWNRLGASRNRVFRVTSRAEIKHVWVNAYVKPAA